MIRTLTRFAVLAVVALFSLPALAQTLDGGVDPPLSDLATVVTTANSAGESGVAGVAALIFAALVLVTRLLVRFGRLLPGAVGLWFASPVATWVLPLALSVSGALVTALTSGQPVSLGLVVGALFAGLAAGGIGSVPAKMAQLAAADAAGADAAAKVTDAASAAETFRRGPNP